MKKLLLMILSNQKIVKPYRYIWIILCLFLYSCKPVNCSRIKYSGQIICKCHFKTSEEYYKLLDDMKGDEYEAVVFPDGQDPCENQTALISDSETRREAEGLISEEVTDSTQTVTDVKQVDTLPLMDYRYGKFTMSENLPLYYLSDEGMITFAESFPAIKIVIDKFDNSKIILNARIQENTILTNDSTLFSFDQRTGSVYMCKYGGEQIQLKQNPIE